MHDMGAGGLSLLLIISLLAGVDCADLASDTSALLAFRSAVDPSGSLNWNASLPTCQWRGVTCDGAAARVTALRLPGSRLINRIPSSTLGNLTALRILSLRFNGIQPPLPADFAELVDLQNLNLNNNPLSGDIPPVIFSFRSLRSLSLAGCNLTGEIPAAFNNMTNISALYLQSNKLTGNISYLDIPNLRKFNVSFNNLTGPLPSRLRSFDASSFLGTSLCGGPLGLCPDETSPAPAPVALSPVPAPPIIPVPGHHSSGKLSAGAIAGIAIGAVVLFVIVLAFVLFIICRKGSKERSLETAPAAAAARPRDAPSPTVDKGAVLTAAEPPAAETITKRLVFFGGSGRMPEFDLEDLLRASAEVLGKGTLGTTYKAILESGTAVVVKRLKDVTLSEPEFRERIAVIGNLQHSSLVPLLGYYFSRDEKLLVYDFLPIGSLSSQLHGTSIGQSNLTWKIRSSIALGVAQAINFIHSTGIHSSHGNIKSSNVLLTKSYEPRVSEHGLATLVGQLPAASRITGYRAPEVTDPRKVSQKADVYSFGVLLLELLTGKAPAHAIETEEGTDLPRWAKSVVREEWSSVVFDKALTKHALDEEEMVQLLQLAMYCTEQHPDSRPAMPVVVDRIEVILKSNRADVENESQTAASDDSNAENN